MKLSKTNKEIRFPLLFLLLLTFIPVGLRAQQGILKGRFVEADMGIPNVHLLNLTAERATISNAEGYFTMDTQEGDTLLISAIRYQRKTFVVSAEMLSSASLLIELEPFVNELEEVVLRPYNLSGDLDKDLINLEVDEPVTAFSLNLPNANAKKRTQSERKLIEATTGSGLVPLNPILNGISGRTKMLKKRLARDKAYQLTQEVRARYPDSMFVSDLGIPEIRIPDFMYFCEVDTTFADLAALGDDLKMWDFLKTKGVQYRKTNELD